MGMNLEINMSVIDTADRVNAIGSAVMGIAFVLLIVTILWGPESDHEIWEKFKTTRWRHVPFLIVIVLFLVGVTVTQKGSAMQSSDAYQQAVALRPPLSPGERVISDMVMSAMGYYLAFVAIIAGIAGIYFFSSMFLIGGIRTALQRRWLDEKLMGIAVSLFAGLFFVVAGLLGALGGAYMIFTGDAAKFIERQAAQQSQPSEAYLRIATTEAVLLDAPTAEGSRIGTLDAGDSVMLLMAAARGSSPVNGYLPCLVSSGREKLKKGWVLATHLRNLEGQQEYYAFSVDSLRDSFGVNALKEMIISSVVSGLICVVVLVFFGEFFEHYTAAILGAAVIVTLIGKYTWFGVGVAPPLFLVFEAAVVTAIDAIALTVIDLLGIKALLQCLRRS
jgi:hypothetical protein